MKKIIFTLVSCSILYISSNAQYCGGSGPSVCTPNPALTLPGLSPVSDSLAPVVNGQDYTAYIEFVNYDTLSFGGQTVTLQSLTIDSINNLPTGTCWSTNSTTNTYGNGVTGGAGGKGCIKVTGFVCSPPGQYKLDIFVTANIGFSVSTNADATGLHYYVRVINPGDSITAVDSTQTSSNPFESYPFGGGTAEVKNCTPNAINEVGANINTLSIYPNPLNAEAKISFNSDKAGMMTERITDMLGSEVYRKSMEVNFGANTHMIERSDLAPGVYFYSISDGKSVYTKRLVVTE